MKSVRHRVCDNIDATLWDAVMRVFLRRGFAINLRVPHPWRIGRSEMYKEYL